MDRSDNMSKFARTGVDGRDIFHNSLRKDFWMGVCHWLSFGGALGSLLLFGLKVALSPCFDPADISSPGAMIFDLIDVNDDCRLVENEITHARGMFSGDLQAEDDLKTLQEECQDSSLGITFECIERSSSPLCCSLGNPCSSDVDCSSGQKCISCQLNAAKTCESVAADQSDCAGMLHRLVGSTECYENTACK